MKTSDFNYDLPPELIAQTPLTDRTASRLLVLNKDTGELSHHHFYDIRQFLRPGDRLVLNDTKVLPARLLGARVDTGTPVEILLLKRLSEQDILREEIPPCPGRDTAAGDVIWEGLAGPGKRARVGHRLSFGEGKMIGEIVKVLPDGNRLVRFTFEGIFEEVLDQLGQMPLPPYIHETLQDKNRYQTVYAREEGSAAAPTAGLHFTKELLADLEASGIDISFVTLHVGLGTFRPVKVDDVESHVMHREVYRVSEETAREINDTKAAGGRIIAVGTTSCRTLESASTEDGIVHPGSSETGIFIYPGYRFKVLDGLITNFHLPESTLIMLVSALAGKENIMNAYHEAVKEKYRFFSFGDAMFIN
ncbi:MAG: tRNA preQ1(34) S-adenosylmethionine ribosyltransferase-isomerase QueA [Lachnospiraceae bacterium]|nr:tRNA preQ1(34) S-adenosylmethionine ribosyltransferase-isomerase QueA [Lachnospiraceae bacterium]